MPGALKIRTITEINPRKVKGRFDFDIFGDSFQEGCGPEFGTASRCEVLPVELERKLDIAGAISRTQDLTEK